VKIIRPMIMQLPYLQASAHQNIKQNIKKAPFLMGKTALSEPVW